MTKRVVILGGGVGGLSAAHELIERGFEVDVFEARDVPGGKARSIYVPNTGKDGRSDLPGEHGFRFFPGFYKHLPDTMKRIPFRGQADGVAGNLVQGTHYLTAAGHGKNIEIPARLPRSLTEWKELLLGFFRVPSLGIPEDELLYFVEKVLVLFTSCQERRLAEYEKIPWWDFLHADRMSPAGQQFLATGMTRAFVALRAEEGSTRTIGDILIQLLIDLYDPEIELDRSLNGPTTEQWLRPWLGYLQGSGVRVHFEHKVTGYVVAQNRIAGVRVVGPDGVEKTVTGDYYISAMPVERVVPLMSADMVAADPRLGLLKELHIAWMNGIQFFLKTDYPLVRGHANFIGQPWALTGLSQAQFWARPLTSYGDGTVHGVFSLDISDWESKGVLYNKAARDLDRDSIAREVLAQVRAGLDPERQAIVAESNISGYFLDPDIVTPNAGTATNAEPLLLNVADTWQYRPEAATALSNFFFAADFVRTYTDLATMEGANEAARRAVNAILVVSASNAPPCRLWPFQEPLLFAPARELDLMLFRMGRPHLKEPELPPSMQQLDRPVRDFTRLASPLRSILGL